MKRMMSLYGWIVLLDIGLLQMWKNKKQNSRCANGDNIRVGDLCCGEMKVLFDGGCQLPED